MALSDKTNLLVRDYIRQQYPTLEEGVQQYLDDELARIEQSLSRRHKRLNPSCRRRPGKPVKGMVRYAVSGWDPLGDGSTGLMVYNGTLGWPSKHIHKEPNTCLRKHSRERGRRFFANQAAKRQAKAMDRANAMRMMPYTDLQPYLLDFYEQGTDAFKDALDKGYYSGDTLAGMDSRTAKLASMLDMALVNALLRTQVVSWIPPPASHKTTPTSTIVPSRTCLATRSTRYAADNVEPLLTAAMRDQRRKLEERDLPGNNMMAQGSRQHQLNRAGITP